MRNLRELVAEALEIDVNRVTSDLEYQGIPEWSSLAHFTLMAALESEFGARIDAERVLELSSYPAIEAFANSFTKKRKTAPKKGAKKKATKQTSRKKTAKADPAAEKIHRGLTGLIFDRTRISKIDSGGGQLYYRGYAIDDLVAHSNFEETFFLLAHGRLPQASEYTRWCRELAEARQLPAVVLDVLRACKDAHPMEALRTAISLLAVSDSSRRNQSRSLLLRRGTRLVAQAPLIIAAHDRLRRGLPVLESDPKLLLAENFFYLLQGKRPSALHAKYLDRDLVVHAEHSSNASAFAARVAIGAKSDFYSAMTTAVGVFAGSVHGGAVEEVVQMLKQIGEPERAAAYVKERMTSGAGVPGFGHRVYRAADPRAKHLYGILKALADETGDRKNFEILEAIVEAMRAYAHLGLDVNVDFFAGVAYQLMGIADDLFVSLFMMSRFAGLTAHIVEQAENNILIRPLLQYDGELGKPYVAAEKR